jgi:hypothetical protein
VYWMYGDSRSAISAIAQSVATQARNKGQRLASFFFSWQGVPEGRELADLIPTIMYSVARFDKDYLRSIAQAIRTDPDIRDKEAQWQISVLLKSLFSNTAMSSGPPLLIVIDALDACDRLDDPKSASDVALFIQTLTSMPLRVKFFITSRFARMMDQVVGSSGFPVYRSSELPLSKIREPEVQVDFAMHISDTDKSAYLIN